MKIRSVLLAVVASCLCADGGTMSTPSGCRASWDDSSLTVENALMTRTWRVDGTVLRTVGFALKGDAGSFVKPAVATNAPSPLSVTARVGRPSPVSDEALVVTAVLAGRTTTVSVYATVPGVVVARDWTDSVATNPSPKDYKAFIRHGWALASEAQKSMDVLALPYENLRLTEYRFFDQTDVRDTLMTVSRTYGRTTQLPQQHFCAVMDAYEPISRQGAVFMRLGPQPASRPGDVPDFVVDANRNPIKLVPVANGYPLAELLYRGPADERIAALQALQRAVRPYRPGRDGVFLSNTWGGGNCDSRINAAFLEKEVDAGAEIGVDVIQIDDGWQHGRTSNSSLRKAGDKGVWNGYWAADPDFWLPAKDRFRWPRAARPAREGARHALRPVVRPRLVRRCGQLGA